MKVNSFIPIGNPDRFTLIAGPCVIETPELTLTIARELKKITDFLKVNLIFKASFDKANRSSLNSYRGPGLEKGLEILAEIKQETGLPALSDIHTPDQAAPAAEVLDVLQIPAFLCRQTDLLVAAGKTGKVINLKKGQFMAAHDMKNAVNKLRESGAHDIMLCERGTFFGYNNLVVDFRSIAVMKDLGCPVVFDATHCVQLPGGAGTASDGDRKFIPLLSKAAVAAGADALFWEVHPNPDQALCDGPNSLPLDQVGKLLDTILKIRTVAGFDK